jgi:nitronate monooxygenase
MGTAYLHCPEAPISAQLRAALGSAKERITAVSNVVSGRPARVFITRIVREVGPIATNVPSFPLGGVALAPLRAKAESQGSDDFVHYLPGKLLHSVENSRQVSLL